MTRAERHAQVVALKAQGLSFSQIAAQLGLARSTVTAAYYDPSGEEDRRRKRRYERPCVDCGATINPNGIRAESVRCRTCHYEREREMSRRWVIDSINEWADLFGTPPSAADWNPAKCRADGMEWKVERYEATGRAWPSVSLAQDNFGSWSAAIAAAGWEPRESGKYGRDGEDPAVVAETVRLYRSGLSCAQVGEVLDAAPETIRWRLVRAGEPRRSATEARWGVAA